MAMQEKYTTGVDNLFAANQMMPVVTDVIKVPSGENAAHWLPRPAKLSLLPPMFTESWQKMLTPPRPMWTRLFTLRANLTRKR